MFENWNSANLEDYEEDETVPDFFETLLYSNAKNVILSLYGDCGEKFQYEFYVSEYMCWIKLNFTSRKNILVKS